MKARVTATATLSRFVSRLKVIARTCSKAPNRRAIRR